MMDEVPLWHIYYLFNGKLYNYPFSKIYRCNRGFIQKRQFIGWLSFYPCILSDTAIICWMESMYYMLISCMESISSRDIAVIKI